jgi:hypothetical protein
MLGPMGIALPPRIEDTEEWAQLGCFLMADVTVLISFVIKATGSVAIEGPGVLMCAIVSPLMCGFSKPLIIWSLKGEGSKPLMGSSCESIICPEL